MNFGWSLYEIYILENTQRCVLPVSFPVDLLLFFKIGRHIDSLVKEPIKLLKTIRVNNLLGQTPGATEISSMAIFPRLFLPTMPSKTI